MRKIIFGLAATAAIAVPLVMSATSASAAVSVDNGIGTVGKGDVQTALGWNNKAFDDGAKTLMFTTGGSTAERINVDYPMFCFNFATGDMSTVGHRLIVQPGMVTTAITATPVLNAGNGKQITGFDLTSAPGAFKAVGNAVSRDIGCEGGMLFMNSGTPTQPLTVTVTGAVTGGLKVNGIDLPNTPALAPVA